MKKTAVEQEKSSKTKNSKNAFIKLGLIFLGILLVVDTIQLSKFGGIVERVDEYNKGVVDELGGFRKDITTFGDDINEMRNLLLLPSKDYSFIEKDHKEEESLDNLTEQAIYGYLNNYSNETKLSEKILLAETLIKDIQKDENFIEEIGKIDLKIGKIEEDMEIINFKISDSKDSLFSVIGERLTGEIKIQSAIGEIKLKSEKIEDLNKEIFSYITKNKESIKEFKSKIEDTSEVIKIWLKEEIGDVLNERKLVFDSEPKQNEERVFFQITDEEGVEVTNISLERSSGQIKFNGKIYKEIKDLKEDLKKEINNLDGTKKSDLLISERKEELEQIIKKESFQEYLKTLKLEISSTPREDYNKLLYDVTDEDKKLIFSFVIELSSGNIKILKDNEEKDLYMELENNSKKKLLNYL